MTKIPVQIVHTYDNFCIIKMKCAKHKVQEYLLQRWSPSTVLGLAFGNHGLIDSIRGEVVGPLN